MKNKKTISVLVFLITVASLLAGLLGIFTDDGPGQYDYKSIRGEDIKIYGRGLYKHMSAEVAIQGIAQDYVTVFICVPLLLIALFSAQKNSLRGRFLLSGVLMYFMLTYLFYTAMGMYNEMFLTYVLLMGCSLFAFVFSLFTFNIIELQNSIIADKVFRRAGIFLIINACLIALLWLSVIVPPIFNGTLYPDGLHHYTTMIVQGFDLGIFLPMGFVTGYLVIKRNAYGYLFTPVYTIFLSLLMTALVSKIIFMANAGANEFPVIFIMPLIALTSVTFSVLQLRSLKNG